MRPPGKLCHKFRLALMGAMIAGCDRAHNPTPACPVGTQPAARLYEGDVQSPRLSWCHREGDTGPTGRHGPMLRTFVEGLPAERSHWEDGQRSGPYERWACNGQRLELGSFLGDERQGCWKTWFRAGGLESVGCYEEGQRQGLWVNWHPGGSVHLVRWYVDDERSGPQISWTDNGTLAACSP